MTARLKLVNPPRASESHNTKLLRPRELRSLRKVGAPCPEWGGSFVVLQKGIIEPAAIKERTDMNAKIMTAAQRPEENFNEHESGDTDARFFALRAPNAHKQQSRRCGQYSVLRK